MSRVRSALASSSSFVSNRARAIGFLCIVALLPKASLAAGDATPNFAGLWGRDSVTFESPATGPGPVVSRTHTVDALAGDYTNPILQPWAAAVVKHMGDRSIAGITFATPHNQCWPQQPPYIFVELEMQIVQGRDEVLLLYVGDHEARHVRLNAEHPAHVNPSWYGNSVGHYEGDTLVVDTIGISVTKLSIFDAYGTPYTGALHLVERYRLIDGKAGKEAAERNERDNSRTHTAIVDRRYTGKALQMQLTVEDPGTFTRPFTAGVTYRKANGAWPEVVCSENPGNYFTGRNTTIPVAQRPDF
jgi:hypothetical protein